MSRAEAVSRQLSMAAVAQNGSWLQLARISAPGSFGAGRQRNLIDAFVVRAQGEEETERWRKGWSMGLNLGWSL